MNRTLPWVAGLLLGSSFFFGSALARAADGRQACVEAADTGQTQRDQGKLQEARESFVSCARDTCPAVVANQCTAWLAEVDRDMPTLSFRVSDAAGKELVEAQVFVDGALRVKSIDGRVTPVNPGPHHLRFVHAGDADVEQDVVAHVGDKARPIEGHFTAKAAGAAVAPVTPEPEPASKGGFRFPLLAAVSLGVSGASFITMGVLVGTTASDVNHLRATCAGSCSPSEVSSDNTKIVVANVLMGVGIVAAAGAATSLLVVNLGHRDHPASQAMRFGVGPGFAQLSGTF